MSPTAQSFTPRERHAESDSSVASKAGGQGEFSLAGKVILLTGGAGEVGSYGRDLAADLAAAGATLLIASRDLAARQKVAAAERAQGFTTPSLDEK